MLHFTAEFSGNIESLELYEMLKIYNLSVTDIITKVFVYGYIHDYEVTRVVAICLKFGVKTFQTTKKSR